MTAWFFIAAAGMVAAALALVAPPLFSRGPEGEKNNDENERRRQNITEARRRMRELRQRRENGEISEDDFAEARAETERALLDDLAAQDEGRVAKILRRHDPETATDAPDAGPPRRRWFAAAVCFALPVAAGILYLQLGEPRALFPAAPNQNQAAAPSMDAAIAALRGRLAENPDNPDGWILLARSLATVGRFAEAAGAFARARDLTGDNADLLTGEAEARARAADNDFSGEPARLLARALELEPENPAALWLSGLAAAGRNDPAAAVQFWRRALPRVQDAEARSQLQNLIAEAEGGPETATTETESATETETAAATAEVETAEAEAAETGVMVEVRVALSPEFSADPPSPESAVFIFARAAAGPRIPLAAVKRRAAELPFSVVLSDAMAMTPQLKLSQFPRVDIVARVSRTGNPQASPGDWFGEAKGIPTTGGGAVALTIDRRH